MGTGNLILNFTTTKKGQPFNDGKNGWYGLSDPDLANMVAMAVEVEDAVKKQANKNGPLDVTLSAEISGGTIPPGFGLEPRTYTGLSLHGYSKVEHAMDKIAQRLLKMGRDHAIKKEGLVER